METREKSITPTESMQIIEQMIASAKGSFKENGFLFLFWGWLVFALCICFYIMQFILNMENAYRVWYGILIGVVVTIIYVVRTENKKKVKSYIDEFMAYIWWGFAASIFIVLCFMNVLQLATYPMMIVLYGIGTFLSGGALRFKPLIFGGIACWLIAIVAFLVVFKYQVLLLALSLIVSYIIPGHILKSNYRNGGIQ